MSEHKNKLNPTKPVPAESWRGIEREIELTNESRRPPTMVPGAGNPHLIEDSVAFHRRLYRPHSKKWVTVSVWIFFILIPALLTFAGIYSFISRFIG